MNKEIIFKVFHNRALFNRIFKDEIQYKIIIDKSNEYSLQQAKKYRYDDMIESPLVLVEYGYLDLLKQYYNKYPLEKVSPSSDFQIPFYNNNLVKIIQVAIKNNNLDILNYYFNELKTTLLKFQKHTLSLVRCAVQKKRWEIIDFFIKLYPRSYSDVNRYIFTSAPLSGSLDRLKSASALVGSMVVEADFFNESAFDNSAYMGRIDMIEWLDMNRPAKEREKHSMYQFAIRGGHLDVIKYLVEKKINYYQYNNLDREFNDYPLFDRAVEHNQFEIVKYLHYNNSEHGLVRKVNPLLFNYASNASMELLQWLHENRTERSNYQFLSSAALEGRLDIIKWAHINRPNDFTSLIMASASLAGHLHIVQWLHENSTHGTSSSAMDYAACRGYLEVVEWLHFNRTEGCTNAAMEGAGMNGHLDVVEWLQENRTEVCRGHAIDSAATNGHLNVVKWYHENRTERCNYGMALNIITKGYYHVAKWLFENREEYSLHLSKWTDHRLLTTVLQKPVGRSNLEMFQWLITDVYSTDAVTAFRSSIEYNRQYYPQYWKLLNQRLNIEEGFFDNYPNITNCKTI